MNIDLLGYTIIIFIIIIIYKLYQDSDIFNLKCIISTVDGNKYCVRDREKLSDAADVLAKTTQNMNKIYEYLLKNNPNDPRTIKLKEGYNPKNISETLPTSQYKAYSENKGEKLAFCLNKDKDSSELIDVNTLTYVAVHEMSHIATESVGHTDEFWNNFKFLLTIGAKIKVYNPVDYKKKPKKYCGMDINDNPYYDI